MKQKICALALTAVMSMSLATTNALAAEVSFSDTSAHWAREAISKVVEKGLFQGTSADTFSPNVSMSRGMFVTVLGRFAESMGYPISGNCSFTDISPSAYYAAYVSWATDHDIVKGLGNYRFGPDEPVTREQMCTLFLRFLNFLRYQVPDGTISAFADADQVSKYAVDAVGSAVAMGLIQGSPMGNAMVFRPGDSATRAEVAAVFLRLDGLSGLRDLALKDPVSSDTPEDPGAPSVPGAVIIPPLTAAEAAQEAQIADCLRNVTKNFSEMVASQTSYYATTGPEAQACAQRLVNCIQSALNDRANGKVLTKDYIQNTYKNEIAQVKADYKAMTDKQATEFYNIAIRLGTVTELKMLMDYFGLKL